MTIAESSNLSSDTDCPSGWADAVGLLHAGIDAVQAVPMLGMNPDELLGLAVEVLRASERLEASAAVVVAECDTAKVAPRVGTIGSLTALLAAETHGPTAAIAPSKTLGVWLIDFPEFTAAWQQGTLTEEHVRELKGVDNPRTHLLLQRDQRLHIDAARNLEFTSWLNHLAYWLLHADPDGSLPKDRDVRYGLSIREDRDGNGKLTGILDPLTTEALETMLDHETAALRRAEVRDGVEPIDQCTTRELQLIALMRLAKRGYQRPDGGWPAPLINIVMSETVAEDLISRVLDGDTHDPHHQPLDFFDIDQRCETVRGTPLDPRRAWPALIVGWLRRQVMTAPSRKMNVGHDVRLFTAAQKQALLVAARGQCSTRFRRGLGSVASLLDRAADCQRPRPVRPAKPDRTRMRNPTTSARPTTSPTTTTASSPNTPTTDGASTAR